VKGKSKEKVLISQFIEGTKSHGGTEIRTSS
jgi:hypothetical protein